MSVSKAALEDDSEMITPEMSSSNDDEIRNSDELVLGRDDFIVEDVGCLEVVVDDSQPASNVLHEGMVEPELD